MDEEIIKEKNALEKARFFRNKCFAGSFAAAAATFAGVFYWLYSSASQAANALVNSSTADAIAEKLVIAQQMFPEQNFQTWQQVYDAMYNVQLVGGMYLNGNFVPLTVNMPTSIGDALEPLFANINANIVKAASLIHINDIAMQSALAAVVVGVIGVTATYLFYRSKIKKVAG